MRISLKSFGGMQPKLEPHLLGENIAQDAVDVVLERGSLRPLKSSTKVINIGKNVYKIYRFGKSVNDENRFWFKFAHDADITRGSIPDDKSERTYFTQDGQPPRVTDATIATSSSNMPSKSYRLGIPTPKGQARVTINQQGNGTRQLCFLAYTYVSEWGEEGAANEAIEFNAASGEVLKVTHLKTAPQGDYNIKKKRLYVSVTDKSGVAVLRFWQEVSISTTEHEATLDFTLLGEALPEFASIPPPDDLFGIMAHPSGFMVGFSGQKVYRSEPFKPYAWPHFSPVADDIVGGAVMGQSTVICTRGGTYWATQTDPVSFTPHRLEGNQPCVAKRTIKAFRGGVIYASPDGLVLVSGNGALTLLTESIFTREQWQSLNPNNMHAEAHDGLYYCFYDNGKYPRITEETSPRHTQESERRYLEYKAYTELMNNPHMDGKGCLIFDFAENTLTRSSLYATAAYSDPILGELYLALEDGFLHKWDSGNPLTTRWHSRRLILERPQNIGAVQIIADSYPVHFELEAVLHNDSGKRSLKVEVDIENGRPRRLLGNYRAREFSYWVHSQSAIREITLASTLANITSI